MNFWNHGLFSYLTLPWLTAALLAVGCSNPTQPDEAGEHAGHAHGAADACPRHGAPLTLCFLCNPAAREPGRLWCGEHNRYEDRCWDCHPEARDAKRAFCDQHGLYEDECFLCRPELRSRAVADGSQRSPGAPLFCREHGVPEAECGICRPERAGRLATGQGLKVRLPSVQSAAMAGIATAPPGLGPMSEGLECYAEMAFDQNKLARIAAPVGGIIQEVLVDLGSKVEEKQAVARIWSASIAEAVAKAVLTHQTLIREQKLHAERVTPEKDLQEAEATHRAACQQLRTLGFTEAQIDELGAKPQESVLLEVRAPFAGEIVERTAVRGELVEVGKPLFTLADREVVWAMLNIPESALARVRVGQQVVFEVDALPGRTFAGRLTWIAAEVDERSRMARARAEVPNPDGLLKARMFAKARILTRTEEGAMLVPAAALQHVEGRPILFVRLAEDLFEARAVQAGARSEGRVEIVAGLDPAEQVAVEGAFALKSQFLISRLGAGCVDE